MEAKSAEIYEYASAHSSKQSELLDYIERQTHIRTVKPRMISGHIQGRILAMLSQLIRPQRILEIGTFTGYSALCLAEGLSSGGKLITIEKNPELESFLRDVFGKSHYGNQIELLIGDAQEILSHLEVDIDLVFIDADKVNYLAYYKLIIDKVVPGGLILADNVLWSGKVVEDAADKKTEAIRIFNSFVAEDQRVEKVILPVRDGITLIRKVIK